MAVRAGLLDEIVRMAFDTIRANKMRSGLTVLGVVIGITSIVGMTALIRGFDESLRDTIRTIGPDTIYVAKFSGISASSGATFEDLLKRPNMTPADAEAIERNAPSVAVVDVVFGRGGGGVPQQRLFYAGERTKPIRIQGTGAQYPEVSTIALTAGRYFTQGEVDRRRNVIVIGDTVYKALFAGRDAIGKTIRVGLAQYDVVGVLDKLPSPGGFDTGVDDVAFVPYTAYQKQFGLRSNRGRGEIRSIMIAAVPREGVDRAVAMREVEEVMRVRHGLRLDQPNDFDLVTQDAILALWDQISQATFFALVVISSIALMVGGIGVMAIMTISVTERTREIGVRKALGARRVEILWQFLFEAVFVTSLGGIIGIALGTAIGVTIHLVSGFPISLPWWSFAIGMGFSAGIGVLFGMIPAVRASRMDPIEALRYE